MNTTLQTDFAGVPMLNPFLLASAPPASSPEKIARSFDAGWGGAVIKTMQYTPRWIKQNVNPRITAIKENGQTLGFTNFEIGSNKTLEQWAEGIRWLKKNYPDHALFCSLLHTDVLNENEWREITRMFDQAGADGFELNLSCSHGQAESGCGAVLGTDPEKIKMVISWVREETRKPVMPKLTALTMDIQGKGLAAKEAGADAITAINTIRCLPGIDLKTFIPYNTVDGKSALQGLSGKAIKPIALMSVSQLAPIDLPISATGGIYTWKDAVEFILAGATTLQVCSAVMQYGYGIVHDLKQGLLTYMDKMGFQTLDEFCGKALPHIVKQIELSRDYKLYGSVNKENCVACGRCVVSCNDSGFGAIRIDNDKAAIDRDTCDGCGLCAQICPKSCITMKRK
jgi:dihydropyrimidine dehydrogenase (NAD+) subunit PreA